MHNYILKKDIPLLFSTKHDWHQYNYKHVLDKLNKLQIIKENKEIKKTKEMIETSYKQLKSTNSLIGYLNNICHNKYLEIKLQLNKN